MLKNEEYQRFAQIAKENDRSLSWLGAYAVRRLLEAHDAGQLPLPLEVPERG